MKDQSRRKFLKTLSVASVAALAGPVFSPRFSFAEVAGDGRGKNIVLVNLYGGSDGLACFPPIGNRVDVMNSLRPKLYGEHLDLNMLQNVTPEIAFHPNFAPLYTASEGVSSAVEAGEFKLISNIGVPNPDRSHRVAQQIYSVGMRKYNRASPKGWIARLTDEVADDTYQVMAFGTGMREDFQTDQVPPILLSQGLSSFNLASRHESMGGANETRHSYETLMRILEMQGDLSPHGNRLVESLRQTSPGLEYIASARNQSTDSYPGTNIGGRFRDVAKLIRAKRNGDLRNKVTLYFIADGGYDSHSSLLGFLPGAINRNASAVSAFRRDLMNLEDGDVWKNTVVYFYSEFGRTSAENGSAGTPSSQVGTDHGAGNMHFLVGGDVDGAGGNILAGEVPSQQDLSSAQNYLTPVIDYRSVPRSLLAWAGLTSNQIYSILPPQSNELEDVGGLFRSANL